MNVGPPGVANTELEAHPLPASARTATPRRPSASTTVLRDGAKDTLPLLQRLRQVDASTSAATPPHPLVRQASLHVDAHSTRSQQTRITLLVAAAVSVESAARTRMILAAGTAEVAHRTVHADSTHVPLTTVTLFQPSHSVMVLPSGVHAARRTTLRARTRGARTMVAQWVLRLLCLASVEHVGAPSTSPTMQFLRRARAVASTTAARLWPRS